jgi:maltose/moltooligosaccharide transporter
VTSRHYGTTDAASAAFNEGANWVGVLFAAYNGFAALAAILIPFVARRIGRRRTHLLNLSLGGAGLIAFLVIDDPQWLLLAMVGVGIAWASILSLPYAMLSGAVPAAKMGIYMGIFNFFIVIPQILAASVLGVLVRVLFGGQSIYALATGGVLMVLAGLATLRVEDHEDPQR